MSQDLQIITGLAGPQKGKRLKVKKTTISIGSNRKCDITLKGEYVSDLHAVVKKREDGVWVVQNNSVNGTLVNGERADLKVLAEGDRIQVGADSLFEVSFEAGRKKTPRAADGDGDSGSGVNMKQLLIYAGVGIYLAAMAGVVIFLSSRGDVAAVDAVQQADVAGLVEETRAFMLDADRPAAAALDPRLAPNLHRAMSMEYFELRTLVRENGSQPEIERLADSIAGQMDEHLFRTWQYEQRRQFEQANVELEKVFSLVPDIRSPSAAYSLQKISEIRARINDE